MFTRIPHYSQANKSRVTLISAGNTMSSILDQEVLPKQVLGWGGGESESQHK